MKRKANPTRMLKSKSIKPSEDLNRSFESISPLAVSLY